MVGGSTDSAVTRWLDGRSSSRGGGRLRKIALPSSPRVLRRRTITVGLAMLALLGGWRMWSRWSGDRSDTAALVDDFAGLDEVVTHEIVVQSPHVREQPANEEPLVQPGPLLVPPAHGGTGRPSPFSDVADASPAGDEIRSAAFERQRSPAQAAWFTGTIEDVAAPPTEHGPLVIGPTINATR